MFDDNMSIVKTTLCHTCLSGEDEGEQAFDE